MAAKEQSVALTGAGSAENYETDFFEWTQSTADMIRQRRFSEVDWEHVAEEINDMGLRDRREVRSRLIVLIMHLLKWQLQPEKRARSTRRSTIVEQRRQLGLVMEDSPSLARIPHAALPALYRAAVKDAVKETGLRADRFPEDCPYTAEQVLDGDFFPA
jgi:hypothetical protein